VRKQIWEKPKIWSIIILATIFLLFTSLSVLAGEGDGSGGGQTVPLGLASSTPSNGQTGVELQPLVKLTFNKNVINLAIRDVNKNCFALVTSAGSQVPIEVIMADDQLYPEEKRNISVKPLQALQPGTAYTLKISPELMAKNGTSLGHEVTLNFVTEGTAAAAPAAVETQPKESPTISTTEKNTAVSNDNVTSGTEKADVKTKSESQSGLKTNTEPEASSQLADQPAKQSVPAAKEQQKQYTGYPLVAGIILLVAAGLIYYRKQKK
jgi:hypothetical protein